MAKKITSKKATADDAKADTSYDDIIQLFRDAEDYWAPIYADVMDDYAFYAGDQWDPEVAATRSRANLSVLTYNKVAAKVHYVVNNVRDAVPQVKIRAAKGGQENTAKVINGLIHQYERDSNADEAKLCAYKSAVIGGIGAWEIYLGDIDDDGDIDIAYDRIVDVTSVLMDPSSHMATHEDAEYCFVKHNISKRVFSNMFPEAQYSNISDSRGSEEDDTTEIVDYWFKADDGSVKKYVINGECILKKYEKYAGKYIPIVLLHGEEVRVGTNVRYHGIVHGVRDMQRMLNLAKSRSADDMALAPTGQYLATAEMVTDYKPMWQDPAIGSRAVLLYKAGPNGEKPTRNEPYVASSGFYDAASAIDADISSSIGIKDTSRDLPVGASGKAIQLQMTQSDVGTYEYADNLNRAVRYSGKIMLDLIQKYLSAAINKSIVQPDGSTMTVPLNQPFEENGSIVMHNLTSGEYGVDFDIAPSYMSQRQQALDNMLEYLKLNPQQMSVVSDLVFNLMDVPQADEFAARLRATIPPQILAASSASNLNSDDPQVKNQIMQSQLQQATSGLQQAEQQINELQQQVQQLELQQKSRMDQIEAENAARMREVKAKLELEKAIEEARMQHEIEMARIKVAGEIELEKMRGAVKSEIASKESADRLNADLSIIHEKTHAEIFEKSMEMDQAERMYERTGTDLQH